MYGHATEQEHYRSGVYETVLLQRTTMLNKLTRAGVAGLTTALVLSKREVVQITILAKHMPGGESIEYTSLWAGANYLPYVDWISHPCPCQPSYVVFHWRIQRPLSGMKAHGTFYGISQRSRLAQA